MYFFVWSEQRVKLIVIWHCMECKKRRQILEGRQSVSIPRASHDCLQLKQPRKYWAKTAEKTFQEHIWNRKIQWETEKKTATSLHHISFWRGVLVQHFSQFSLNAVFWTLQLHAFGVVGTKMWLLFDFVWIVREKKPTGMVWERRQTCFAKALTLVLTKSQNSSVHALLQNSNKKKNLTMKSLHEFKGEISNCAGRTIFFAKTLAPSLDDHSRKMKFLHPPKRQQKNRNCVGKKWRKTRSFCENAFFPNAGALWTQMRSSHQGRNIWDQLYVPFSCV